MAEPCGKRRSVPLNPPACGMQAIETAQNRLTLNQLVPGSSPGAPTKEKAFFSNTFAGCRSRTKRVSRAAFRDRTRCDEFIIFSDALHGIQCAQPSMREAERCA